ncbi:MAG: hypothetical protein V2A79_02570 [Planctomycetota bacterium]
MTKMTKWVYSWGNGKAEGKGTHKDLLGGKGAGLAEMTKIALPIPSNSIPAGIAADPSKDSLLGPTTRGTLWLW